MKKSNLPSKLCVVCKDLLIGEKNGNLTGIKSNFVQKDL